MKSVAERKAPRKPQPRPLNARAIAALVLAEVLGEGRSLSSALPSQLKQTPAGRDAGLVQELCFGVARYAPRLQALADALLQRPLKRKDVAVQALLLIGLYQLIYLRTPPHAAVAEAVAATRQLGFDWASGLVNGVLRQFQRESEALQAQVDGDEACALAHPRWLLEMVRKAWPEQWRAVLEANNARPPMTLRVNARLGTPEQYQQRLQQAGIVAQAMAGVPSALVLAEPCEVGLLPGFDHGWVSVQDGAAQMAAFLLDLAPGQRVLDACAAPGGKTCHILEQQPALAELVALDSDALRLERVRENLARLSLQATLVCADAADTAIWWDGQGFDRILLDAPCSATGVIRRHPDIKLLRRPDDIAALVAQQQRLLQALWPLLKPGGRLVYATCSILPRENSGQVAAFLASHDDARECAVDPAWGRSCAHGRQQLPGEQGMDGFYYAVLERLG